VSLLATAVAPKRKAVEMKADLGLTWIDVLKEINAREKQAKANHQGRLERYRTSYQSQLLLLAARDERCL
jgi:hypothetical protein